MKESFSIPDLAIIGALLRERTLHLQNLRVCRVSVLSVFFQRINRTSDSSALPREQGDGFDVGGVGKHVHHARLFESIAVLVDENASGSNRLAT